MKIAIVGDFDPNYPLHPATEASIRHAARGREVQIDWLPTESLTHAEHEKKLSQYAGFFIAPGSPYKSLHGALNAIRFAREQKCPLLATCGGFQHVVIEYARHVLGFADAQHAEYDPSASRLFVSKLACSLAGRVLPIELAPGSVAHRIYGRERIEEHYYCNFGLNPEYRPLLERSGLAVTGIEIGDEPSRFEARIIELPAHPFFIATLFVPQAESREKKPHPVISAFLEAVSDL